MASFKVLKNFRDKETGRLYIADNFYSSDDNGRIAFLADEGYIEAKVVSEENNKDSALNAEFNQGVKHTGGGWYQLPNGEKIQGKDEALIAFEELQKSGE